LIWFTESYADSIGVLDPSSGKIEEIKMSQSSTGMVNGPAGLTIDRQGDVWFAKLEGKVGHIRSGTRTIELIDVPSEARRPAGITAAKNGDIWAVALDGNLLLRYSPATRSFSLYPIPTGEADKQPSTPPFSKTSRPFGIASDNQGNIWFSEQYTGQLGVLDVSPPEAKVLSPSGTVRTDSPLLTTQVLDRVAGVEKLIVKLDGAEVQPRLGRLDLLHALPGQHKIELTAIDGAGLISTTIASFSYAPNQLALVDMLATLKPRNKSGEKTKASLIATAKDLLKGDIRIKLDDLRQMLSENGRLFEKFDRTALNATIDFQLENAGQTVEVAILDRPPFFSQAEVTIRTGDTVKWKYEPLSDGHSISHQLHRIEISANDVRSAMLRSGESFSYRFERTGEFSVRDLTNPKSTLVIRVLR
jgi:plastocyanin